MVQNRDRAQIGREGCPDPQGSPIPRGQVPEVAQRAEKVLDPDPTLWSCVDRMGGAFDI